MYSSLATSPLRAFFRQTLRCFQELKGKGRDSKIYPTSCQEGRKGKRESEGESEAEERDRGIVCYKWSLYTLSEVREPKDSECLMARNSCTGRGMFWMRIKSRVYGVIGCIVIHVHPKSRTFCVRFTSWNVFPHAYKRHPYSNLGQFDFR